MNLHESKKSALLRLCNKCTCITNLGHMRYSANSSIEVSLFDSRPTFWCKPFLRQETPLVVHLAGAPDPVAEVHICKAHTPRPRNVVKNHESAEGPVLGLGLIERIDHGQPVFEHVGQRHGQEFALVGGACMRIAPAVFDQPGLDMAVLDHHSVVEYRHIGHSTVVVAGVKISAEYGILLGGRHCYPYFADEVAIAVEHATHVAGRTKLLRDNPHRHARPAALAGRPVGDRLATPEAPKGEQIVQFRSPLPDEVGENLSFFLPRQIRAW